MRHELDALTRTLIDAQHAQMALLEKMYPRGARIWFNIMHGQVNPSSGTVTGYTASPYGGRIHALHAEAKPNSRYRYRRLSPDDIVRVELKGGAA